MQMNFGVGGKKLFHPAGLVSREIVRDQMNLLARWLIGDQVRDRHVARVPDAGEHGHGARRDGAGDPLVVERGQVCLGAATAHDADDVAPEFA